MFRKSVVWDKLGGYNTSISISQDWEMWTRIMGKHKIANLPDLLVDWQVKSKRADPQFKELTIINKANIHYILGITNEMGKWLDKLDTLHETHLDHPEHRVEVITELFKHFCTLYPTAHEDPEILKELSLQYLRVLYYTNLRAFPQALKALWLTWPKSTKGLFMLWQAIGLILRKGSHQIKRRLRHHN